MLDILLQLNWVDIIIVILVFRVCYISIKGGFIIEIFKLCGTICAIYLSLHYYMVLGARLQGKSYVSVVPANYFDFFCFFALALLGYFIFFLLRSALYRFMELKAIPALSKWGGFITGLFRSVFLTSLIIFAFSISTINYFEESGNKSYIGSRLSKVAPLTYSWIWNNLTSKFIPQEKFNNNVLEPDKKI
ncbi:MAG: CvpA family protein [Candidatus Omnitrophota bacterium]|jgi:uncharacterized membrane protein required for colicin V production